MQLSLDCSISGIRKEEDKEQDLNRLLYRITSKADIVEVFT